jgi:hypothetical protein
MSNEIFIKLIDMNGSTPFLALSIMIVLKAIIDFISIRKSKKRLDESESRVFSFDDNKNNDNNSDQKSKKHAASDENSSTKLHIERLTDFYNKQIEAYQTKTIARAGWSFLIAIVAMLSGLFLVIFGGYYAVTHPDLTQVLTSTGISAIGAATSAFITKTFLDVHKLSLNQLNHYFNQPVINSNILTAQRLADSLSDEAAKIKAYEKIIDSTVALIKNVEKSS